MDGWMMYCLTAEIEREIHISLLMFWVYLLFCWLTYEKVLVLVCCWACCVFLSLSVCLECSCCVVGWIMEAAEELESADWRPGWSGGSQSRTSFVSWVGSLAFIRAKKSSSLACHDARTTTTTTTMTTATTTTTTTTTKRLPLNLPNIPSPTHPLFPFVVQRERER